MFKRCKRSFLVVIMFFCVTLTSLLVSQENPFRITPDIRFSPNVKIYNFDYPFHGVEDGKFYLDFELTIPKDGSYRVTTFSATSGTDDTDTVLRNYGIDGYSGEPDEENDNYNDDDLFSKIEISLEGCLKGEKYFFRVLPNDASQNFRSFGICYECTEIKEPKKFLIGMYTYDYDNSTNSYAEPWYNDLLIGHDDNYLSQIEMYNFNTIVPIHQLRFPDYQLVDATNKPDRSFLDRALNHGLDVILSSPVIDRVGMHEPWCTEIPYDSLNAIEEMKYWNGHPAVIAYNVADEPEWEEGVYTGELDLIEKINNNLKSNSNKGRFVNLLPLWVPEWRYHHTYPKTGESWADPPYECDEFYTDWLDSYIEKCSPSYLISDYYVWADGPFHTPTSINESGIVNFYYHNQCFAKASELNNLDYLAIVCTWKRCKPNIYAFETKNAKQYDYENYVPLFHGAKGILYWERELGTIGLSAWDVLDTSIKQHIGAFHKKILDHQDVILDLKYMASYHQSLKSTIYVDPVNPSNIYYDRILDECDWLDFKANSTAQQYFNIENTFGWKSGSPTDQIAISFMKDSKGNDYFWLLNKNYFDNGIDFKINFSNLVNLTDVFSGENSDCVYKDVHLNACEAKLFKINRSFEINGIVRVPTGYSILMKNGELLRFVDGSELIVEDGGNFILEEGANIQIKGSAKIQGNAQINSGASISILDKSSLNLQLSQLTIHSNTDIEIGKSAKLIIANGTNFIAEQGSGFIVDESSEIVVSTKGYFTATGTPFTYIADTGKWLGINCIGGSTIDLNDVNISEAETGVKGIYNYKFNVRNSVFTGCDNGISVAELVPNVNYNITGNILTGTKNGTGISITSSNGVFENNDISFFLYGARLTMCSPVLKRNKIWGNKVFGILVSGQNAIPQLINTDTNQLLFLNNEIVSNGNTYWNPSPLFLSAQIGIIPYSSIYMHNGKNHIYSGVFNSTPIIPCISVANMISSANQNIVIDAENNYWGSSTVNDDFFFEEHFQYSIDYTPYYISPDGAIDPDNPASQSTNVENTLISNAIRLESLENNTPAIKLYEHIIKKYVDSPEYYIAMARLPYLYAKEELDNTQLITLYDEALQSVETSNKKFFKGMKVATHIKGKRYDDAITIAEEMKTEAEFEEEVILADINIAIANLLKNMESKGRSESDYTSNLMNLLNKLNGTQENGTPEEVADKIALPSEVSLYQNYPNPFNPVTQIRFDLAKTSDVKLKVYNIGGQVVAELADGVMNVGNHAVDFDGSRLNSGVYYYTLEVNGKSYTHKMILMK